MKKLIPVSIFILMATTLVAQKKNHAIGFDGMVNLGYLKGGSQKKLAFETVGGIKYKNWFAGIGIAYDEYGYTSIPVFLELRRHFGHGNQWQPFIYGDGGFNVSPHNQDLPKKIDNRNITRFNPALYAETGVGISKKIRKGLRINLSAGYSEKKFSYTLLNDPFWGNPPVDNSFRFDYRYRRIAVKLGFEF